jgi:flagellar hook-basal body complex protein FliE
MEISAIRANELARANVVLPMSDVKKTTSVDDVAESFSHMLGNAIQSLDQQEKQVRELNQQFVTGQLTDVHSLMIASEKASLGLQLTVQVRNKVIEAYQEIMRTQL